MGDPIEQIEQSRATGGNTETPVASSKQKPQYKYWSFTFNNFDEIEHLEHILQSECEWYVFQEETGENGTPHLQGTLCLKERQRLTQIKCWDHRIHWEPTKCVKASVAYCQKKETRTGKVYSYGIEVDEDLELEEPRGWQLEIMKILSEKPDKRTIHWFWESKGGVGKTTLCKYLVAKRDALMLTGKSNDMYNMIAKYPKKRKIFVIDVPRSAKEYINYGAIEQIKNGLIFSGKYEGAQLVFNCPHVIVFANEPPNEEKMSTDRWYIRDIESLMS